MENIVDEGAFSRTRDPRDTGEDPKGDLHIDVLRVLLRAPNMRRALPFVVRRLSGTSIRFAPLRYCPVIDSGSLTMSLGVPVATIAPPCSPAPGPMSMT